MKRQVRSVKHTVPISGIWLRTGRGGLLEVLAEVGGRWLLLSRMGNGERYVDGEISQIWEVAGIECARLDPVTSRRRRS